MTHQTIYALASAAGRAGIAVWRLSGPAAGAAFQALSGRALPPPRLATRVTIADPATGAPVDDGLALWFPAPASFTGEDVIELHLHGGRSAAAAMADALSGIAGLRPAEPGEFTRRAFENGKMDLTAAEGLADLVDAETTAQRRQAQRQLAGELGRIYEGWRAALVANLARFEAEIDFSDEDLPPGLRDSVTAEVRRIAGEIAAHLDDGRRGEVLRDGVSVAILGPPNAGKSSLLNRLARREAAIVAATAGTTRDVIEVHLDLGGYPVILADTAGLRESGDAIEQQGVQRALARARQADLKLVVFDGAVWPETDPVSRALIDGDAIGVVNKLDLGPRLEEGSMSGRPLLGVSAETGAGLALLEAALAEEVGRRLGGTDEPALTRERHRRGLSECHEALARFLASPVDGGLTELAAEDLRLAARALGRITGRVDVEELLDAIFAEFCIGK